MTLRSLASRTFAGAASFGARNAVLMALIGLLFAVIGGWRAQHLRIDSDFRALIPHEFPSVQNIDELERRVGSLTELVVEVRSPDRDSNIRFGTELAKRLETLDGRFRWVEVRRETSWFEDRALLFLSLHDLLDLRDRVVRRIRREVTREVVSDVDESAVGQGADKTAEEKDDPLDLDDDPSYEGSIPSEYLEASDEREHLMVVRGLPMRGTTDMGFTDGLVTDVEAAIAAVDPAKFHPEMKAAIRGGYLDFRVEMNSVKTDIFDAGLVALALLLLVLIVQYKRLRVLPLLLIPLVISVLMTVAAATWLYPALNIIAGFIFVVLLGLGIDFGIHLLSRYEFERLRGLEQLDAIRHAAATTGVDVATGAATSVVVFLLFTIAEFRGYSQFGALAAIGVTLAFFAMLFLMPALVVLYERFRPWKPKNWLPLVPPPAETELGKHRLLASVVVFLSLSAALASIATTERVEFEYDLSKLGKNLDQFGKHEGLHWSDAIGHPDVGPAMVLGETVEQAQYVERQFRGLELLTDSQLATLAERDLTEEERRDNDPTPPGIAPEFDSAEPHEEEDEDDPFAVTDPFSDLRGELKSGGLARESKELLVAYPIGRVLAMRRYLHKHLSLWTFVPRRQTDKLRLIADIRRRLNAKWSALTPETQKKAQRLRDYSAVDRPITLADIPAWLQDRWREGEGQGAVGRNVILWNRGNKADGAEIRRLQAAFGGLKAGPGPDDGTVPIAATYLVLPDILDAVVRDGPRILLAALGGVLLWLFAMFRSVRLVVLILVPLASAIAWLAGLFFVFGWKVNIYNIVTFAVLIGIGVDHGIHMVGRWVEDGGRSVRMAVRETGVAIASTSVTTAIGFGGMMVGGHRGLASLGSTAAAGIMLVFIAAMTTLPALLHLFGQRSSARDTAKP